MTITRVIDGAEYLIELTEQEMINVYYEQRSEFDKQDILDDLNYNYEKDSDFEDIYGCTKAEMMDHIEEAASEYRDNMDKYEMGWYDARDLAISEVTARIVKEREQVSES